MTSGQARMRVEWSVLPQQVNAVGAAAHALMTESRREPGCLTCSLSTEMGEYVTLALVAVWDSEESLRNYVRSPRFQTLAGVMESAFAPPRVEFALPDGTRGFEYAERVRRGLGSRR